MSRICLLCGENETQETTRNKICDPCYDNAGDILERNATLYALAPDLEEACLQLVKAYDNGERDGGHVDWDDVDVAFNTAKVAIHRLAS